MRDIRINYFTRKKNDLIEVFKIVDKISNNGRHFLIFYLEFTTKADLKKKVY